MEHEGEEESGEMFSPNESVEYMRAMTQRVSLSKV